MDLQSAPSHGSASGFDRAVRRVLALFEVLLVALSGALLLQAVFGLCGVPPLRDARTLFLFVTAEACVTLTLVALLLRADGESLAALGWVKTAWRRELALGVALTPLLLLSTFSLALLFETLLPQYASKTNPLLEMVKTRIDLALFLVSGVFVGGIKEEVQRAFVLTRFERHLGGIPLGLTLWTAFFAFSHQVQGIDKAVGAGLLGLAFGLLYIRRRKLPAPMVAHALYDVLTLLIFWNVVRR